LMNTTISQNCPDHILAELQRTVKVIPPDSTLLLTSRNKPDERLKSTKLLKQFATFCEFPLIPPWKTELLVQSVQQAAQTLGLKLNPLVVELLAESVGNDTRLLYNELEKLRLYTQNSRKPLDVNIVSELVRNTTQNTLQLA
ncbi:MAG: DNA polymerase III subunit delta, partial [Dolichospermum sp.]